LTSICVIFAPFHWLPPQCRSYLLADYGGTPIVSSSLIVTTVSGVASYVALVHVPPPRLPTIFILVHLKSDSQLSKYCVVCEISWCRCQQLTALSIRPQVIEQVLTWPWN